MTAATAQVLTVDSLDADKLFAAIGKGVHKAKVFGRLYDDMRQAVYTYIKIDAKVTADILAAANPYAKTFIIARNKTVDLQRRMNAKKRPEVVELDEADTLAGIACFDKHHIKFWEEQLHYVGFGILFDKFSPDEVRFINSVVADEQEWTPANRQRWSRLTRRFERCLDERWLHQHSTGIAAGGSRRKESIYPKPFVMEWTDGEPSRGTEYYYFTQKSWQSCDPAYQMNRLIDELNKRPGLCNDPNKWRMFVDFTSDFTTEKDGVWIGRSWFDFNTVRNPNLPGDQGEEWNGFGKAYQSTQPTQEVQDEMRYRRWVGSPENKSQFSAVGTCFLKETNYAVQDLRGKHLYDITIRDYPFSFIGKAPELRTIVHQWRAAIDAWKREYGYVKDSPKERMGQYRTLVYEKSKGSGLGIRLERLKYRDEQSKTYAEIALIKYNECAEYRPTRPKMITSRTIKPRRVRIGGAPLRDANGELLLDQNGEMLRGKGKLIAKSLKDKGLVLTNELVDVRHHVPIADKRQGQCCPWPAFTRYALCPPMDCSERNALIMDAKEQKRQQDARDAAARKRLSVEQYRLDYAW